MRFGLLEGWDREQEAYEDIAALAYVSGPMYVRHIDNGGQEITVPLGDLKFGPRVWRGRNRTGLSGARSSCTPFLRQACAPDAPQSLRRELG